MSVTATLRERFKDPKRWKKVGFETLVFFTLGMAVFSTLSLNANGRLILVSTPSIPVGVYWLDKTPHQFAPGDIATFPYDEMPDYMKGRYDDGFWHTKYVKGIPGYTVTASTEGKLTICPPAAQDGLCVDAGTVEKQDSKGRPMKSWVPEGTSYTLKHNEVWVFGTNAQSLDSRYHGPIRYEKLAGQAKSIISW